MALTDRTPRLRHTERHTERVFDWNGHTNWGFSFPCDEHGTVNESQLAPEGLANLRACLTGTVDGRQVVDRGVRSYTTTYTEPATGKCACGERISLDGDLQGEGIDCYSCGRIYSGTGQELRPREQWEENEYEEY